MEFSTEAVAALQGCRGRGNVRELRNVVERLILLREWGGGFGYAGDGVASRDIARWRPPGRWRRGA